MHAVNHPKSHYPYSTAALIRASNWLESHPKALVHSARAAVVLLVGFTLLNTGLFTVERNRMPAFIKIGGQSYANMPIEDAKEGLKAQYKSVLMTARVGDRGITFDAMKSGVSINADKTLESITERSGWQRLPVVSTLHNLFLSIKPVYNISEESLATTLAPMITPVATPAQDANITVPSDLSQVVKITLDATGKDLSAAVAAQEIAAAIEKDDFTVKVEPKVIKPTWTAADVQKFMPAVDAARRTSLTIQADDKKVVVDAATLAPMLRLNTSGAALKMTLNTEALAAYLEQQARAFYVAPVATKTVQKDGTEVSRTGGQDGKQLDAAATAILATASFESGVMSVTPKIATVTPQTLVTKTYSNTSEGLAKIIEDFAASHKGVYRVASVELNGPGNRSAFYNADSSVITASTYKLFVAYGILQRIENSEMSFTTPTNRGINVDACLRKMIIVSDNDCGWSLQEMLGYERFPKEMKAAGFTSTDLNNTYGKTDKHTTARDEMLLISKLYNHELINETSLQYLYSLMEQQVFRSGIPAGSHGSIVQDKVGFLYALNHDIGIVHSPKATYGLVVMTDGAGGWTNIRLLAEQIYDFYNQ